MRNKRSVMCSVLGGWEQVLTVASAGILDHLGHLGYITRHGGEWGKLWVNQGDAGLGQCS
jgi:hypothetical protein